MAFNADQYMAALEPPTLVLGGKTFVGRLLSFEEWLRYEPRLQLAMKSKLDMAEVQRLIRDLCKAFFPAPWWSPGISIPVKHILALPLQAQMDAMRDFIQSQARAMGAQVPGRASRENVGKLGD